MSGLGGKRVHEGHEDRQGALRAFLNRGLNLQSSGWTEAAAPSTASRSPSPCGGGSGSNPREMAMVEDDGAAGSAGRAVARSRARFARRQKPVRWSVELGLRLCERVAAGELVYVICREPGMPTPEGIKTWALKHADFAEALDEAKRAGGRPPGRRGGVLDYCEAAGGAG